MSIQPSLAKALASVAISHSISPQKPFRNQELAIKKALIDEAVKFPGTVGTAKQLNLTYTIVWNNGVYDVRFGKFGKEYYRTPPKQKQNKYDMYPCVFKNGQAVQFDASFRAVFRLLEDLKNKQEYDALRILGCLFVRNAFLVDHLKQKSGNYRYVIPKDALAFLQQRIGHYVNIPIEVFLMYVDAIAWQEDVKYFMARGKKIGNDVGRKNNMLTYVHFIACLLGRGSFAELLNKYSMGVSPIAKKEIPTTFPELKTSY